MITLNQLILLVPGPLKEDKFFSFKTKSETLEAVKSCIKSAFVLEQILFTVSDWQKNAESILSQIKSKNWLKRKLIIRSSAVCEDSLNNSFAGKFDSILGVFGEIEIQNAVEKVIASFDESDSANQIFIQEMLCNVKIAGVIFTKDPNNGAPYFVINFDDKSGRTDSVTSGDTNELKTFYCHRLNRKKFGDFRDRLIAMCFELEEITNSNSLDIEFAINDRDELYLFQVRPLIFTSHVTIDSQEHCEILTAINQRLKSWMKPHPYLCGDRALYGVMPDWNPAEIIGIKPTPLAISIYREVITNSIWAYQRDNYGYRNLRSFPLLIEFEGMPYIDIRVSFNSFIPASLNEEVAKKLANYYLKKLANSPQLHDKVEFEIVFSWFTFNISQNLERLEQEGFSSNEISQIKKSLLDLTNNIIAKESGLWVGDLKKIEILKEHHQKIISGDLDYYAKLYWLIEDCKRYGTLPFAGLARAAFVAVEILKSMVEKSLISADDYDNFLSSLDTVSSSIGREFFELSREDFLKKYGHLRPGTYDILSKRYDEDPDGYFDWSQKPQVKKSLNDFKLSKEQLEKIALSLEESGFEIDVEGLFEFIKCAIEAREYSKFIFTKSISDFLKIYGEICCNELQISLQDAAYTHVQSILSLNSASSDPKKIITASIERRKQRFEATKHINLPALITDADDVFYFYEMASQPNYITQNKVSGELKILQEDDKEIVGKIVMIPSADPGYDWIFSRNIAGLVTKYGGVNSHMAIRAGELGIPAIIGAGKEYGKWSKFTKMSLDCLNKTTITS